MGKRSRRFARRDARLRRLKRPDDDAKNACRRGCVAPRAGDCGRGRCGRKVPRSRGYGTGINGQARIPRYAYQLYGYRRVRDPTASEVAMSPGPACRHTHMRIYLIFPFYLFGLPLVEGHSSNPYGSVAIIGEHGGPGAAARRPSFSLAGYHSSPEPRTRVSRCAPRARSRAPSPQMSVRGATMPV